MVRKTLANTGASLFPLLSTMSLHLRRAPSLPKIFHLVLLLSYTVLAFTLSEACPEDEMNYLAECITCGSRIDSPLLEFQDTVGHARLNHEPQSSETTHLSINGESDACLFCFLSTLEISGSQSDAFFSIGPSYNLNRSWSDRNWLSDYGIVKLHNGGILSCTLNTKEGLTAWIMVSSVNDSYQMDLSCVVRNQGIREIGLLGIKDRLVVKSNTHGGFQSIAMRPCNRWEIGQHKKVLMEMDLFFDSQEKNAGAFCMRLWRSLEVQTDTVVIPSEADMGRKATITDDSSGQISVSLELIDHNEASRMVLAVYLKNNAPYVLAVANIIRLADSELFSIRYNDGLSLPPGTFTQVASITCGQIPPYVRVSSSVTELSDTGKNCRVIIVTNDTTSPQIEILCQDVLHICLRGQKFSSVSVEENVDFSKKRTDSLYNKLHSSSHFKAVDDAEPDEPSLRNWKSQGSSGKLSVLNEHEILFPLVEIGTYRSKWITVKNPSQEPVMMQLILNSGEIVDHCNLQNNLFPPSRFSSSGHDRPSGLKKHGFSIAENAVTVAFVHPHTEATLGPINFHPSDRCRWRSYALISNSFSGVEWLSLTAFGGSHSLTLLEGSKPVQSVKFFPNLPIPLNISLFGAFFHIEETASTCSQPVSKELFAMNTGDLPLEVKTVRISGSRCRLDGFSVHPCNGFFLQPEESTRLQVSYQADFSTYTVLRELELVLASGILVVPLKSSMLIPMHTLCKRSMFWARLKKFFMAVLLAASLMFLLLHCGLFHDHQFSEDRFCITAEFVCLLRSMGEDMRGNIANVEENDAFKDSSSSAIKVSDPAHSKLTVKTGNGKKKSRKKKKKGTVSELMNSVEFSSSQSGNSTPTSPISPLLHSPEPKLSGETRNQIALTDPPSKPASSLNLAEQKVPVILKPNPSQETGNPFARSALPSKQQDSAIHQRSEPNFGFVSSPQQQISKPVLSVSATFPSRSVPAGTSFGSPLAPHARAPGSKLRDRKPGEDGEMQTGIEKNELRYDIWGDHLSFLHLMDRFKKVNEGKNIGVGDDDESVSFFAKGPQMLFSHPKYVSLFDRKEE